MSVADAQPFVHEQDLGLEAGAHREAKPESHARRVGVRRHGEVVAQFGERRDLLRSLGHFPGVQSEQQAAGHDVLVTGRVVVDAERYVQQRRRSSLAGDASLDGFVDAGEHAQQSRLASTVVADDAHPVAVLEAQGDVVQCANGQPVAGIAPNPSTRAVVYELILDGTPARVVDREVDRDGLHRDVSVAVHIQYATRQR